jgi:hypothetical protein
LCDPRASRTLGLTECQVCVGEQPLRIPAGCHSCRDADRSGDNDAGIAGFPSHRDWLGEDLVSDSSRERANTAKSPGRLTDDDDSVPVGGGKPVVFSQRGAQTACHREKQFAGEGVAIGTRDQGNLVHLDQEHTDIPVRGDCNEAAESSDESTPVGWTRWCRLAVRLLVLRANDRPHVRTRRPIRLRTVEHPPKPCWRQGSQGAEEEPLYNTQEGGARHACGPSS